MLDNTFNSSDASVDAVQSGDASVAVLGDVDDTFNSATEAVKQKNQYFNEGGTTGHTDEFGKIEITGADDSPEAEFGCGPDAIQFIKYKDADGNDVVETPDHSIKITSLPNGDTRTDFANGKVKTEMEYKDGSIEVQYRDGRVVVEPADGSYKTTLHPDGSTEYLQPDGFRIVLKDGMKTTDYPSGDRLIENEKDGSSVAISKTGMSTAFKADGSYEIRDQKGNLIGSGQQAPE